MAHLEQVRRFDSRSSIKRVSDVLHSGTFRCFWKIQDGPFVTEEKVWYCKTRALKLIFWPVVTASVFPIWGVQGKSGGSLAGRCQTVKTLQKRHQFFLPQAHSQDVWEQQRRDKDFEELSGEDAAFLHGTSLPHAERHRAPGVTEVKLPKGKKRVQENTSIFWWNINAFLFGGHNVAGKSSPKTTIIGLLGHHGRKSLFSKYFKSEE